MSFLRHRLSIHPIWKEQTGSRLGAHSRLSSARMSRNRLFLSGSVSTGARFCFTGCAQNAIQWSCRSTNLQRTANSVLFSCLSHGVHPTGSLWHSTVTEAELAALAGLLDPAQPDRASAIAQVAASIDLRPSHRILTPDREMWREPASSPGYSPGCRGTVRMSSAKHSTTH